MNNVLRKKEICLVAGTKIVVGHCLKTSEEWVGDSATSVSLSVRLQRGDERKVFQRAD